MDDDCYSIILAYDPGQPEVCQKVVACLCRLDPTAAEKLAHVVTRGRLVIKRDADRTTAQRLGRRLQAAGAKVHIKRHAAAPKGGTTLTDGATAPAATGDRKTRSGWIKCPNCGFQQPPELECRACGVIISKARGRHAMPAAAPTPEARPRPRAPYGQRAQQWLRRQMSSIMALREKITYPFNHQIVTGWTQRVADRSIRCGIVFIIALILEIGLLCLGRMMWALYCATSVGQYYLKKIPEKAEPIQRLFDSDPLAVGWETTLAVMSAALVLGCAAQFFHLIRYLFHSQGIAGKLMIWFIPSAAYTAWRVSLQPPFPEYATACMLVAVPTLCLLSSCLHLAQAALPEMGDFRKLIAIIGQNRSKSWRYLLKKIRIWLATTRQVD
jgi:hypothetical protein